MAVAPCSKRAYRRDCGQAATHASERRFDTCAAPPPCFPGARPSFEPSASRSKPHGCVEKRARGGDALPIWDPRGLSCFRRWRLARRGVVWNRSAHAARRPRPLPRSRMLALPSGPTASTHPLPSSVRPVRRGTPASPSAPTGDTHSTPRSKSSRADRLLAWPRSQKSRNRVQTGECHLATSHYSRNPHPIRLHSQRFGSASTRCCVTFPSHVSPPSVALRHPNPTD